jgi:hypothetical protein
MSCPVPVASNLHIDLDNGAVAVEPKTGDIR